METLETLARSTPFFTVCLVLLGLVVGSFLNVVIARLPAGESLVRPRSRCPSCGHQIAWYENVPVLSWLLLRGRCSGCHAPISIRYPLVESLTALLFFACWRRFGWSYELAPALLFVTLLIALTFIDAEHWILPLELTVPGTVLGIAMALPIGSERFVDALLGAGVGFLTFRAFEYVGWKIFKKEALGAGDKFLLALIGAYLSHRALVAVIAFASLQGALFGGLSLLVTGRAGPATDGGDADDGPEPTVTMTWAFLQPGLSVGRRLLLLPYSIFLQPIPDEPKDEEGVEVDWQPGPTNMPFGPYLALGALEVLLLGPLLAQTFRPFGADWLLGGQA